MTPAAWFTFSADQWAALSADGWAAFRRDPAATATGFLALRSPDPDAADTLVFGLAAAE